MAIHIQGDTLTVNSQYAWVTWIFYGIFLLAFPPAIWSMWTAYADQIPLWFNLIFTGLFLAILPFLLKEILAARIVQAEMNRATGQIDVHKRGLLARSYERRTFDDIAMVEMQTSDNDGEFHTVELVFNDRTRMAFSHGNHRPGVEKERDALAAFIQTRRPGLRVVEKKVR